MASQNAMKRVTIRDRDPHSGGLSFDLRDILSVLGGDVQRSTWTVRNVECVGGSAADALHKASEEGELLTGQRLIDLARDIMQVIDGEFSGRLPNAETEWITIEAIDSSAFHVLTDRDELWSRLKARFDSIEELPE